MSNLIPEQRVNKLGHVVVKHVRAGGKQLTGGSLPAPSLASGPAKAKQKPVPKARTKTLVWMLKKQSSKADPALREVANVSFPTGYYHFTASDVEAYDVMSVTSAANAFVALACGAKTADDATTFLNANDLGHLIEDHSEMMQSALSRNIPAKAAMKMITDLATGWQTSPTFLDAMEAGGIKALQKEEEVFGGIPFMVLNGEIDLADIRMIGAAKLAAEGKYSVTVEQLKKIKDGSSKFDTADLIAIMKKANPRGIQGMASEAIQMAQAYGPEAMLEVEDHYLAFDLERRLRRAEYDRDKINDTLIWHDKLVQGSGQSMYVFRDVVDMYEAGITAEEAAEGVKSGMTPRQLIGVSEGVARSVADGWL